MRERKKIPIISLQATCVMTLQVSFQRQIIFVKKRKYVSRAYCLFPSKNYIKYYIESREFRGQSNNQNFSSNSKLPLQVLLQQVRQLQTLSMLV